MSIETENMVLTNLIYNEEYIRNVIPYVKLEYFESKNNKVVFSLITDYFQKYNRCPTVETLKIDLDSRRDLNDQQFDEIGAFIACLTDKKQESQWLLDTTEGFCQERAWFLAIMKAAEIVEEKKDQITRSIIPRMMQDVAAISFDTKIGHEFLSDWEKRYEFYHTEQNRIPFDLEMMNKITGGGLPNKTLTIIMGATAAGKTLFMNHMTAANLQDGRNVLYITLEISEEMIAMRIDANLMNVPIGNVVDLDKVVYQTKIEKIQEKTKGRLFIKEYSAASASSAHFRHLLNELKIKKNFIPDIIYVDYLGICASSRVQINVNMYTHIKEIIVEMRGLATEFNVPIVSATQANREGNKSSDPETWNVSESFATPETADFMIALVSNDEMKENNKLMVKQLKSRLGDTNLHKRFLLGVDTNKFRLYDIEQDSGNIKNEDDDEAPKRNWGAGAKRIFEKSKFEGVV